MGKKRTCATRVTFVRFKRGFYIFLRAGVARTLQTYEEKPKLRFRKIDFRIKNSLDLSASFLLVPLLAFLLTSCGGGGGDESAKTKEVRDNSNGLNTQDGQFKPLSAEPLDSSHKIRVPKPQPKWDSSEITKDSGKPQPLTHYMKTGQEEDPRAYYLPQVKNNQPPELSAKQSYVSTKNGVKYVDLKEGFGIQPGENGLTMIHYVGWLSDGSKFESTIERGLPKQFHMGDDKVIPGIQYGIVGMKVGGVRKIVVPPGLAYGSQGVSGKVPPNETVTFVVTLLSTGKQPHNGGADFKSRTQDQFYNSKSN